VAVELARAGLESEDVALRQPTMDDVFLHFTGRPVAGGGAEPRSESDWKAA
jgi:hypothetical protein